MVHIDWNPEPRMLRWFAGLQMLFFAALAYAWRDALGTTGIIVMLLVSAAVGVLGLLRPPLIRWVYVGWMVAVFPIGWTVSHLLLAVAYYGVLTPIGFLVRTLRGDPLERAADPQATTYWKPRSQVTDVERYFRQY